MSERRESVKMITRRLARRISDGTAHQVTRSPRARRAEAGLELANRTRWFSEFASYSFKYYKSSPHHVVSLDRIGLFVAHAQFFAQRARQFL